MQWDKTSQQGSASAPVDASNASLAVQLSHHVQRPAVLGLGAAHGLDLQDALYPLPWEYGI